MLFITSDKKRGLGISLQEQLNNELKELEEAYQKEKSQVPSKKGTSKSTPLSVTRIFCDELQKLKHLEIWEYHLINPHYLSGKQQLCDCFGRGEG